MAYKKLIKVSNVCQLLDKSKYPASTTGSGITWTNNGDGTVTANGTCTAEYYVAYVLENNLKDKTVIGHKYALFAGNSLATYHPAEVVLMFYPRSDGGLFAASNVEHVDGKVGWVLTEGSYSSYSKVELRIRSGATVENFIFKPQLFDLTEMYGAGHEPTTVDQFRQDFPEEMYDYSPHCWLTSYKRVFTCKTKNLLSFPYYGQYETKQGITFSKVSTYKVNASGINTGSTGCTFDFNYNKVFKAGTYTIKFYTEGSVPPELYYRIRKDSYYGGTIISDKEFQKTFTLSEDTVLFISFGIYGTMSPQYTGKKINVNVWCQIEKGNTATDYVPYGIIPSYQRNLTCKTKNLFDISKVVQSNNIKSDNRDITCSVYGGSIGVLKDLCPSLKFGDVVTLSLRVKSTTSVAPIFVQIQGKILYFSNPITFTVTEAGLNSNFYLYNTTFENRDVPTTSVFTDIMIELGDTATDYVPYGHL